MSARPALLSCLEGLLTNFHIQRATLAKRKGTCSLPCPFFIQWNALSSQIEIWALAEFKLVILVCLLSLSFSYPFTIFFSYPAVCVRGRLGWRSFTHELLSPTVCPLPAAFRRLCNVPITALCITRHWGDFLLQPRQSPAYIHVQQED